MKITATTLSKSNQDSKDTKQTRQYQQEQNQKQSAPKSTKADLLKSIPLAFCAAGAHAATVFALGGDPLFGQIGKYLQCLYCMIVI